jgi:RNA polymerase sigma-70 factor (ECF subfamily)
VTCIDVVAKSAGGTQSKVSTDSFETWYSREHPKLIASLVLTTGSSDLASESVDEAFARALEQWDRVKAMRSPLGWTFKVALNHARRTARRRAVERQLLFRKVKTPDVPGPAGEIWHIVADLPPRQRQVVVLRHIGDLSEGEIGEVLGVSRSTVSSTLGDAHRRLSKLLEDDPMEEDDV